VLLESFVALGAEKGCLMFENCDFLADDEAHGTGKSPDINTLFTSSIANAGSIV
jgi:hypothetical protein